MPCHAATLTDIVILPSDIPVEDALKKIKKKKTTFAVVADDEGKAIGVFSYSALFKNLLPVSIPVGEKDGADLIIGAAPGIAKRLKKTRPVMIARVMNRRFETVHPTTPLWQGLKILTTAPLPILVTEEESGKIVGIMTYESAMAELERLEGVNS